MIWQNLYTYVLWSGKSWRKCDFGCVNGSVQSRSVWEGGMTNHFPLPNSPTARLSSIAIVYHQTLSCCCCMFSTTAHLSFFISLLLLLLQILLLPHQSSFSSPWSNLNSYFECLQFVWSLLWDSCCCLLLACFLMINLRVFDFHCKQWINWVECMNGVRGWSWQIPLYQHIAELSGNTKLVLPVPAFNIINGGSHAGNKLAMQVCAMRCLVYNYYKALLGYCLLILSPLFW
jgi:hypothetical protein